MIAKILDGKSVYQQIRNNIFFRVRERKLIGKRAPGLAVISIGNDPAAQLYLANKYKACKETGFVLFTYNLPNTISKISLLKLIDQLNNDILVDGILLQLPLPLHLSVIEVIDYISPTKDVDGFHSYNIGRICHRVPLLHPCISKGIIKLLNIYGINIFGVNAVIVGASNFVGRPISLELLLAGCTITVVHRFTYNLKFYTKNADLLVVAVGKPYFINKSMVKYGSIVLDVGINFLENGKIVGDVDPSVCEKASFFSPVPGGIGPMTVAMLLDNTLSVCEYYDK